MAKNGGRYLCPSDADDLTWFFSDAEGELLQLGSVVIREDIYTIHHELGAKDLKKRRTPFATAKYKTTQTALRDALRDTDAPIVRWFELRERHQCILTALLRMHDDPWQRPSVIDLEVAYRREGVAITDANE